MTVECAERPQVEFVRHQWRADPGNLAEVRRMLREWLRQFALPTPQADAMLLALCEAIGNAMRHAYPADGAGVVTMVAWCDGTALNVEISDHGSWRGGGAPDSGLGIDLMRHLVDSVSIAFSDRGTLVRFRQRLGG